MTGAIIGVELIPAPRPAGSPRRGRQYPKRCFERAAKYVLDHPEAVLVHGMIDTLGWAPFAHAWCETPDGLVYDGVDNEFYEREAYYTGVRVDSTVTYTPREAAELMVKWGMFSTWDLDDELRPRGARSVANPVASGGDEA